MSAARPLLSGLLSQDRKALPSVTSCTAGCTAGAIVPTSYMPDVIIQHRTKDNSPIYCQMEATHPATTCACVGDSLIEVENCKKVKVKSNTLLADLIMYAFKHRPGMLHCMHEHALPAKKGCKGSSKAAQAEHRRSGWFF